MLVLTFVRVHVELGVGGWLQQEWHTLKSTNRSTCSRDSSTQSNHGMYIGSKVGGIGEYHRNTVVVGSWCTIIILDPHERHTLKSKHSTCSWDSSPTQSKHDVYIGSKVDIGEYRLITVVAGSWSWCTIISIWTWITRHFSELWTFQWTVLAFLLVWTIRVIQYPRHLN